MGLLKAKVVAAEIVLFCRIARPLRPYATEGTRLFMLAMCVQESNVTTLHLALLHGEHTEAIPLLERALSILAKGLGGDHPHAVTAQNNLEVIRQKV